MTAFQATSKGKYFQCCLTVFIAISVSSISDVKVEESILSGDDAYIYFLSKVKGI